MGEIQNPFEGFSKPADITIHGLEFHCTSHACPEQYDVIREGEKVGYVRLRYGVLDVEVPDVGGEIVLQHTFDDPHLGKFNNGLQRQGWLERAVFQYARAQKSVRLGKVQARLVDVVLGDALPIWRPTTGQR